MSDLRKKIIEYVDAKYFTVDSLHFKVDSVSLGKVYRPYSR